MRIQRRKHSELCRDQSDGLVLVKSLITSCALSAAYQSPFLEITHLDREGPSISHHRSQICSLSAGGGLRDATVMNVFDKLAQPFRGAEERSWIRTEMADMEIFQRGFISVFK